MRSLAILLLLAVPAVAADQVNILPEGRIDLKPTPRDATVPFSPYSYPASYKGLHDGKFPEPTAIPEMDARKPKDLVGDRRFFAPMAWGAAALSPDGKLLACGGTRVVTLFDAKTGLEDGKLYGDFDGVNWLRFSPDSKRLYSTTTSGSIAGLRNVNTVLGQSGLPKVPKSVMEELIHRDALSLLALPMPGGRKP